MKKLTEFSKNTFHYTVIKRHGNLAIIKAMTKEGGAVAYETIHIRERLETKLFDNVMPATEYGPGNEEFGSHGFCYTNKEAAEKKFLDLIKSDRFETNKYLLTHNTEGDRL